MWRMVFEPSGDIIKELNAMLFTGGNMLVISRRIMPG